jgi:hypothetical protein
MIMPGQQISREMVHTARFPQMLYLTDGSHGCRGVQSTNNLAGKKTQSEMFEFAGTKHKLKHGKASAQNTT